MKSPRTRWPRPSRDLGLLVIAGVLGGWIMVARPAPLPPGPLPFRGGPPPAPGGLRVLPGGSLTLDPEFPGPIDRCLIPAPNVDHRFAVPAPQVNDRMVVAP